MTRAGKTENQDHPFAEFGGGMALKTTAARIPPGFVQRPQLALERLKLAGMQVMELAAPDGFGKTSQLAQWHKEALLAGDMVMWLSLEARDDGPRFVRALANAASRSAGRGYFQPSFTEWIGGCADTRQALTGWLAEIARLPRDALLLLDDADLLSEATRSEALEYLVVNAPGNLRIALALRPKATLSGIDVFGSTPMMRITARELRLREEDTSRVVRQALDDADATDLAVRIHALTEGWPLGIRLAVASRLRNADQAGLQMSISADLGQYFLGTVIARLPEAAMRMLVHVVCLDPLHPDLCRAVAGPDAPVEEIARLADESPILSRGEDGVWYRIHPAAREVLAERHALLPEDVRRTCARNACRWYESRGMLEEAAGQARLAGDEGEAMRLAEASLRAMTQQGRHAEVLQWYDAMPTAEVAEHPGFWAPTCWALALSERVGEVPALVERILGHPGATDGERYEANLILAASACYRDDLRQLEHFAQAWPSAPPAVTENELMIHAVSVANGAMLVGRADFARHCLTAPQYDPAVLAPVSQGFVDLMIALCYLWEGKPRLAYDALAVALPRAEARMDRWNRVVAMLAAAMAQACIETGRIDEARLHLSLRLPALEKNGAPDAVIAGHCVLAEIADAEGRQDQAIDQLLSLAAIGRARAIPRMELAAGYGLVRLHTRRGRWQTAAQIAATMTEQVGNLPADIADATRAWCGLHAALAAATAHSGATEEALLERGVAAADTALALATQLGRGADMVHARYLRAAILARLDRPVDEADRAECDSLCDAAGLVRLKAEYSRDETPPDAPPPETKAMPFPATPLADSRSILTPREQDILERLVRHMSNKEIALSMGLGEETVKWHLKNLFLKLDAGDRKNLVVRARTLGIIQA